MTKTWTVALLLGFTSALAWGCGGDSGHGAAIVSSHTNEAPAAETTVPAVVETPETSPLNGHYERTGEGEDEATLDIAQVGPDLIRIKGFAEWVGNPETGNVNTGDFTGTARLESRKAHFENTDGCKLDLLFQEGGVKVENTEMDCGGLNVTFDGEYKRTGPPKLGGR
jgi:hypothetical protein